MSKGLRLIEALCPKVSRYETELRDGAKEINEACIQFQRRSANFFDSIEWRSYEPSHYADLEGTHTTRNT
jgi:hypothetical protein